MSKKRFCSIFVLFSIIFGTLQPIYSESNSPEPYDTEEFPESLKDLRRLEIVTLGAMPFVTLDVTIAYSGIRWVKNDFSPDYSPNPFASNSFTPEEQKKIILSSLGISLGIGLSDLTVRFIKRKYAEYLENKEEEQILITPIAQDPDAIKLENKYDKDEVEVVE